MDIKINANTTAICPDCGTKNRLGPCSRCNGKDFKLTKDHGTYIISCSNPKCREDYWKCQSCERKYKSAVVVEKDVLKQQYFRGSIINWLGMLSLFLGCLLIGLARVVSGGPPEAAWTKLAIGLIGFVLLFIGFLWNIS